VPLGQQRHDGLLHRVIGFGGVQPLAGEENQAWRPFRRDPREPL
jgi:hypothetical protein